MSRSRLAFAAGPLLTLVLVLAIAAFGCGGGSDVVSEDGSTAANLSGRVGTAVTVGDAVITVRSLQAAFQPISPAQRISDEPLIAPAAGVTFYQAYVNIENRGPSPLRIDPEDFVCRIGNTLSVLEPTRSGPVARSIINGTSLDLVLTFRGEAGFEPTLVYSPPWYSGLVLFGEDVTESGAGATTTTVAASTTTEDTTAE